jgi:hypothetical protein
MAAKPPTNPQRIRKDIARGRWTYLKWEDMEALLVVHSHLEKLNIKIPQIETAFRKIKNKYAEKNSEETLRAINYVPKDGTHFGGHPRRGSEQPGSSPDAPRSEPAEEEASGGEYQRHNEGDQHSPATL